MRGGGAAAGVRAERAGCSGWCGWRRCSCRSAAVRCGMSPGREGDISKCPVVHGKGAGNGGGGLMGIFGTPKSTTPNEDGGAAGAGATTGKAAGCPVMVGGKTASTDGGAGNAAETPAPTFNEYGEQVDPRNQMPTGNQEPWPGQQQRLSTERVQSAIPKGKSEGESGETWTYPSPQQFYNALKRKGKGADVSEEQVDTLVSIHNNMNDVTWQLLLEWEQWHINRKAVADDTPRLAKFMGRPFDLTPKARIKSWLGYGLPVRAIPIQVFGFVCSGVQNHRMRACAWRAHSSIATIGKWTGVWAKAQHDT